MWLICLIVAGIFPNYEAVLSRKNDKILELDADEVSAAVRRVALLANEQSNAPPPLSKKPLSGPAN